MYLHMSRFTLASIAASAFVFFCVCLSLVKVIKTVVRIKLVAGMEASFNLFYPVIRKVWYLQK